MIAAPAVQAFPGAYGWGAEAVGGRDGQIIEVTNLNDSGPGSFREAVGASGPRILRFLVSGIIRLLSDLTIAKPFLTIDAFPAGITLVGARLKLYTHNVIMRDVRLRGRASENLLWRPFLDCHDVILDHCSFSWGKQGNNIGIWHEAAEHPDFYNFTIQNCIIAESLAPHPTGMMCGTAWTEAVDYIDKLHHVSIHSNLFVHNGHRNPRVKAQYVEVLNNVVYNWANRIGGTDRRSIVDWRGNYFKAGPMTSTASDGHLRHASVDSRNWDIVYPLGSIYFEQNISPDRGFPDPDADNWAMITEYGGPNKREVISEDHRRLIPLPPAPFPVPARTPQESLNYVLGNVGARELDKFDLEWIEDVKNGTGPTKPPIEGRPLEEPMSVITSLEAIESELRAYSLDLTAQADAIAQVIADLRPFDDVLDAAADVIEVD